MLIQTLPDTITKLAQMGDVTSFEPAGDKPEQEYRRVPYQSHSLAECITHVSSPKGKLPILKTMVTLEAVSVSEHGPLEGAGDLSQRRDRFKQSPPR